MNIQKRMGLLEELAEGVHGCIRGGWMDYLQVEKAGHPLEGVQLRLRWHDDGTVHVEHMGETILVARIAVDVIWVPMVNELIGGELPRTWATVPAGWFVKTPKGVWLEVGHTSLQAGGVQHVSLIVQGQSVVFPRNPTDPVTARRGSLAPRDRDDAMASLEEAFTTAILHDEPPGQS